MEYVEFQARIEEALRKGDDPNLGRNMLAEFATGGMLLDLCCQITLMEKAVIQQSIGENLLDDASIKRALAQRGQIEGIRQVLQMIWTYLRDERARRELEEKKHVEVSEYPRAP